MICEGGLQQCKSDFSLYFCLLRKLYLIIWVDDLFFCFPTVSMRHAEEFWAGLQKKIDLEDWQDVDDCLGCRVVRDRKNRKLSISQAVSVKKLLDKTGFAEASPEPTPMAAGLKLSKSECPTPAEAATMADSQRWFRSTLASLIYPATWTRPDIAYSVSKVCKFMHNPGKAHFTALKRILRYLAGTCNRGLVFDFANLKGAKAGIYGYYDASHADCPDTRRSTLAYIFFFEGAPISWHTKSHSYVTTSTNHSEYCAAAKGAREAKWLEHVCTAIGFAAFVRPIDLFSDSKGAIAMTYNPVQRAASKHVDLADHYAREQQDRGTITISYVSTKEMIADLLTKALGRPAFEYLATFIVKPIAD